MNHNRSTALERSIKITGGLKPVLRVPNLALTSIMAQNIVVRSAGRFSNTSMDVVRDVARGISPPTNGKFIPCVLQKTLVHASII